jgi:hypothetical protein
MPRRFVRRYPIDDRFPRNGAISMGRTRFLAAALVGVLAASLSAQEPDARQRLSVAEMEKLHRLIKPQPGESRWMEIDWYPSVWGARQMAARAGKPLFLWAGSGGAPAAGC